MEQESLEIADEAIDWKSSSRIMTSEDLNEEMNSNEDINFLADDTKSEPESNLQNSSSMILSSKKSPIIQIQKMEAEPLQQLGQEKSSSTS